MTYAAHLRRIGRALRLFLSTHERIDAMTVNLNRLTADIAQIQGVVPSAVAALNALRDEVAALKATVAAGDTAATQAALDDLAASLEAATQPLAQAIAANATPAAPTEADAKPD